MITRLTLGSISSNVITPLFLIPQTKNTASTLTAPTQIPFRYFQPSQILLAWSEHVRKILCPINDPQNRTYILRRLEHTQSFLSYTPVPFGFETRLELLTSQTQITTSQADFNLKGPLLDATELISFVDELNAAAVFSICVGNRL